MFRRRKLRDEIRKVLREELQDVLDDASWRVHQAWDDRQVPAEGLNLKTHQLTGYTVTSNSPVGGSIAWSDLHVVFEGTDYGPYSGNTANKYVWFDQSNATPIQTSASKPTLAQEDAIIFINDGGTVREPLKSQLQHGAILLDGTLDTAELADAAVIAAKIVDGGVTTTKLDDDAVTTPKLADNSVTTAIIAGDAVTNAELADNSVNTEQLQNDAVTNTELADDAVTDNNIADDAVRIDHLGSGVVTGSNLVLNGGIEAAVDASNIPDGWKEGWTAGSGDPIRVVDAAAPEGRHVGELATYGYGGVCRAFPVEEGAKYHVTYWVKSAESAGIYYAGLFLKNSWPTGGYVSQPQRDAWDYLDSAVNKSTITSWTKRSYTWTCPANYQFASFIFLNYTGAVDKLWFDDVRVVKELETADLADDAITNTKLADDSVDSAQLIDDAVVTAAIAPDAVTNSELADNSVNTEQLQDDAITVAKMAANAVDSEQVVAGAIDTDKLNVFRHFLS